MKSSNPSSVRVPAPKDLRLLAEQAARVGGAVARQAFGRRQKVSIKSDQSEVTEIDVAAERAIVEFIRAARPHDVFLGEESLESGKSSAVDSSPAPASIATLDATDATTVAWIIDPIDGTRNYIRHMPLFTCSVAALRAGVPVAGAIFEPIQDTLYSAQQGGGLRVNGKPFRSPIAQPSAPGDEQRKLYVGIPSARRAATKPLVLHAIDNHIVRNFGSVALHLALVALGHLDAVVVGNAKLWDIAAGCLLVEEAGGRVTAPDGAPLFPVDLPRYNGAEIPLIAATKVAYERLLRELADESAKS